MPIKFLKLPRFLQCKSSNIFANHFVQRKTSLSHRAPSVQVTYTLALISDLWVLLCRSRMSDFLADCAERIIVLGIVHRRIINRFHKFVLWLGIPLHRVQDTKPNEFCRIVSEFALEYRTTRERVIQQLEKKANHRERNKTRGKMITEVGKFRTKEDRADAELRQLLGSDISDVESIHGTLPWRRQRKDATNFVCTHDREMCCVPRVTCKIVKLRARYAFDGELIALRGDRAGELDVILNEWFCVYRFYDVLRVPKICLHENENGCFNAIRRKLSHILCNTCQKRETNLADKNFQAESLVIKLQQDLYSTFQQVILSNLFEHLELHGTIILCISIWTFGNQVYVANDHTSFLYMHALHKNLEVEVVQTDNGNSLFPGRTSLGPLLRDENTNGNLTDGDDELLESLVKTATKTPATRTTPRERKRTRHADHCLAERLLGVFLEF
ncbi:FH1/FH2 domain-containing protein 3 [Melipona quadrifasciata]|uniref:FH1/FH2 domain-containing protein 3 n=1 Tax=Melipona quadrifasciata TaxID=166423 RepID=A0A0M8ZWM9_9HYME|nr:FH1/FH2 domain-containing protein 3 [Melipona quadrifasciata]